MSYNFAVPNQLKRYLHVKDDNTLALSDEPKSSMRKVANYMYNYAAKLGQNLTPKEQEKVSKIRENLGKMLSRYKEKEKDFLNSKGFLRRVLYSVYFALFGVSRKLRAAMDLLPQEIEKRKTAFNTGIEVGTSSGNKEKVWEAFREQEKLTVKGRRIKPTQDRDGIVVRSSLNKYLEALKRKVLPFKDLKTGDVDVQELAKAFSLEVVDPKGRKKQEGVVEGCFIDIVNGYTTEALEANTDKILSGLAEKICHHILESNLEESQESLDGFSAREKTLAGIQTINPKYLPALLDKIKKSINSPDCQAALRTYFRGLIEERA